MLVDSQMQASLFAPAYSDYSQDLNDIFHTELFSAASSSSSSGSASSGSRESTPHVLTPPQPPVGHAFPDIAAGSPTPSFFNFLDEDVKALDPLSMLSDAPYDFFGAFAQHGGSGGDVSISGADLMMGIDPQLVGSPAAAPYADFDSTSPTSNSGSGSNSNSSPDSASLSPASSASPEAIAPVKVGGHGKARKGTVATGGIKKASAPAPAPNKENTHTSANAFMPATPFRPRAQKGGDDDEDDDDLPADWRPPPEVFQKMSSKEKRQLRNKISARNFRVRRKEYISTLEDNIAERDRLLSAIRAELGSTQSENSALRQEIAALKRSLLDNRGPAPVLPPPAPLSSFSPSLSSLSPLSPTLAASFSPNGSGSGSGSASGSGRASPLPRAMKDVGASGVFWGGAQVGGGGYTSVHTARIPELLGANPWAQSPFAQGAEQQASPPHQQQQQENLNPALNGGRVAEVVRAGLGFGAGTGPGAGAQGAEFGDANPFTVRSLDAYRMHLWGRMAAQHRHNKEHPAAPSASSASSSPPSSSPTGGYPNTSSTAYPPNNSFASPSPFAGASFNPGGKGLAGGLRPKYFASPAFPHAGAFSSSSASSSSSANGNANGGANGANGLAAALAGLALSGKGAGAGAGGQRAQRESQRAAESQRERERAGEREREQAMYAALASQTLLRRLGGAFWEAFSGAGPSSSSGSAGAGAMPGAGVGKWDAEKVRKVLEGRAVVRVVDVEPQLPQIKKEARECTIAECGHSLSEAFGGLNLGKK